jgi:hypothetical protein
LLRQRLPEKNCGLPKGCFQSPQTALMTARKLPRIITGEIDLQQVNNSAFGKLIIWRVRRTPTHLGPVSLR